jgi:hypothetical protein
MKPTPEQETKIRLLSDTELYEQAEKLVSAHPVVAGSQMEGLLEYSRSWDELTRFVKHQKDDRNWGEPGKSKKAHYRDFYTALDAYLNELYRDVKGRHQFVPGGLTKKETSKKSSYFAGLLAREFIQHLVAEMLWQEEVKSR